MITMPIQVAPGEYTVFIVLEDENIAQINRHDPMQVNVGKLGPPWDGLKLLDIVIAYLAPGADTTEFHRLIGRGQTRKALAHLTRGMAHETLQ